MAPDQVPPNNFPNTLANCAIRQYARGMTTSPGISPWPDLARDIFAPDQTDATPRLLAALDAVEKLHYADEPVDGVLPFVCADGTCEHQDNDCPEVTITPCYECSYIGEHYIPWPCPTINAVRGVAA